MKKVLFALSLGSVLMFSCKKDDDPGTPSAATNVCTGTMGSDYFPLKVGDSYTFTYSGTTFDMTFKIYGKTTINGTTWAQTEATTPFGPDTSYLGKFSDGSFVSVDIDNGVMVDTLVLIPANPTVGLVWYNSDSTKYEITSLSDTLTTPACSYSGLLEVTETDYYATAPTSKTYYKKGVGMIADECLANDCMGFDLMYLKAMSLQP